MAKYVRQSRINAGGQGEVWRGVADDGTPVAIKYMHIAGTPAQVEEDLRRFKREITCQSSLEHPGVLPILAMNLADPEPHFVMPVADESLRDVLDRNGGGLGNAEALRIFAGVLDAVAYAHTEGVIHRDLKPENVLMTANQPQLADFGLGRRMYSGSTTLTMANVGWGSYAYSAPEQFTNLHSATPSADVFALGRIFYELLTGQVAVSGIDYNLVPAEYRYVIMTAVQMDPSRRFVDAGEMQREIALLSGGPTTLLAPAERAAQLISQIAAGDRSKIPELGRVLIENGDDVQVYLQVFVQTPETVLSAFALAMPNEFREVMRIFDTYADGGHPWSFTDTLAFFLRAAFRASTDLEVRTAILERLLVLGFDHSRWYVRDRFIEVVEGALEDPVYAPVIARVLRNHPDAVDWVRDPMINLSLPPIVAQVFTAA